ncbi:MAG TPA: hypothetical protein VGO93_09525 [Candidatus Xenobia bacterium]
MRKMLLTLGLLGALAVAVFVPAHASKANADCCKPGAACCQPGAACCR